MDARKFSRRLQSAFLLPDFADEPGVPVRLGNRRRSDRGRQRVQRQVPGLLLYALQLGRARERHEVGANGRDTGVRLTRLLVHACMYIQIYSLVVSFDVFVISTDFVRLICFSTRSSTQTNRHGD